MSSRLSWIVAAIFAAIFVYVCWVFKIQHIIPSMLLTYLCWATYQQHRVLTYMQVLHQAHQKEIIAHRRALDLILDNYGMLPVDTEPESSGCGREMSSGIAGVMGGYCGEGDPPIICSVCKIRGGF